MCTFYTIMTLFVKRKSEWSSNGVSVLVDTPVASIQITLACFALYGALCDVLENNEHNFMRNLFLFF